MIAGKRNVVCVLAAMLVWATWARAVGPPHSVQGNGQPADGKELIKRWLKATYGTNGVPSKRKNWYRKLTGGARTSEGAAGVECEVWESADRSYHEKTCLQWGGLSERSVLVLN